MLHTVPTDWALLSIGATHRASAGGLVRSSGDLPDPVMLQHLYLSSMRMLQQLLDVPFVAPSLLTQLPVGLWFASQASALLLMQPLGRGLHHGCEG